MKVLSPDFPDGIEILTISTLQDSFLFGLGHFTFVRFMQGKQPSKFGTLVNEKLFTLGRSI